MRPGISSTITTVLLALTLLCFFLPFAEISCNQVKYISLSGREMLKGKVLTEGDVAGYARRAGLEKEYESMKESDKNYNNIPPNGWAIAAFAFLFFSIVVGVMVRRFATIIHLAGALAAVIAFVGLQISMNSEFSYSNSMFKFQTSIRYLAGYWMALILSGLVAGISFIVYLFNRKKPESPTETQTAPSTSADDLTGAGKT